MKYFGCINSSWWNIGLVLHMMNLYHDLPIHFKLAKMSEYCSRISVSVQSRLGSFYECIERNPCQIFPLHWLPHHQLFLVIFFSEFNLHSRKQFSINVVILSQDIFMQCNSSSRLIGFAQVLTEKDVEKLHA